MAWKIKSDRPVYIQLMEHIKIQIISGVYKAGDKFPVVRDLAVEAEVNPNTMQKALSELERENLLYSKGTMGRFVTDDVQLIEELKKSVAHNEVQKFLSNMNAFGYTIDEIGDLLRKVINENEQNR